MNSDSPTGGEVVPVRDLTVPVLLAGTAENVVSIAAILADLDDGVRGQVFVEVECREEIIKLPAPGRVVVTWLVREDARGIPAEGALLQEAVQAWLSEMRTGDEELDIPVDLWIAGTEQSLGVR